MGVRILVVDDEESLRGLLIQILTEDGYEVTAAASGEEALELFKKNPFPLVITDIRMGKMSGIELLQEIKKIHPNTQVVVMTSHSSIETASKVIEYGASDYIIKPFDQLETVSEVVNRVMKRIELIEGSRLLKEKLDKKYGQEHL